MSRAWRSLPSERRLAAGAAIGLFFTLFLPWYQDTVVLGGRSGSASLTGWGAFSFVEAAVLLVAVAVLILLFQRAEGRAFHIPGGDGSTIMAGGLWAAALVVWRIFDKQSVHVSGPGTAVSGVEWGIFMALAVALLLAYAGSRVRAAHTPEPLLPGEEVAPADGGAYSADERFLFPLDEQPQSRAAAPPTPVGDPALRGTEPLFDRAPERPAARAAGAEPAADRAPERPRPRAAEPTAERPRGWLSAKPKQRLSDEQLTIPLDEPDD